MTSGSRPTEVEVRTFLQVVFGPATDDDGTFQHGQLPVWDGTTKRTKWCASIAEATAALTRISAAGHHAYLPVALHDPEVALTEARRRAEAAGKDSSLKTLVNVRGCTASARVLGTTRSAAPVPTLFHTA